MADKRIQDLTPATSVQTSDRFVLEQSGQAKSLTGQVLINDLATALDGHGGISNISYTEPTSPSLDGTLTITMADETEYYLSVTNGRGITDITWTTSGTAGDGMTHTGTIDYNDGTSSTVAFQDGVRGEQGAQTYVWFKWSDVNPTSDTDMQNNVGAYIGVYSGTSSTAPTHYTDYVWYQYKGETGDTGASIQSITKISTSGLVDTYQVLLTNGNTSNFTVTNAKSIVSVTMISGSHAAGTTDVYAITFNDGDTANFSVYNGANGQGSVSTVSGIQADGTGNVPQIISANGPPTTATIGQRNQLYYDLTNSILYYCAGESGGTYTWQGAGVTVDSALSGSSTNPVQNKVITNRIGTGALPNSSSDLTTAINYVNGAIPPTATTTPLVDTTGGAVGTGNNWAKNDHQHPLNVATSGVPVMDGTASLGTATTYAKSDHVHPTDSTKVSKVGDTMSGDLLIEGNSLGLSMKTSTIIGKIGDSVPTSNKYGGHIYITDANDDRIFYSEMARTTADQLYRSFVVTRLKSDGTTVCGNGFYLRVNADGTPLVTWYGDSKEAWLSALGLGSSGSLPVTIGQGGTGQTEVTSITTASTLLTAASGVTIASANFAKWGKLASLYVSCSKSSDISSTNTVLFTMKSGYRPAVRSLIRASTTSAHRGYINTNGEAIIAFENTWASGSQIYYFCTYLLA